jgi:hypothetical protein
MGQLNFLGVLLMLVKIQSIREYNPEEQYLGILLFA